MIVVICICTALWLIPVVYLLFIKNILKRAKTIKSSKQQMDSETLICTNNSEHLFWLKNREQEETIDFIKQGEKTYRAAQIIAFLLKSLALIQIIGGVALVILGAVYEFYILIAVTIISIAFYCVCVFSILILVETIPNNERQIFEIKKQISDLLEKEYK